MPEPRVLKTSTRGWIADIQFSSCGTRLISVQGGDPVSVALWDLESDRRPTMLFGHKGHIFSVATTSDFGIAFTGSEDRTVRVWDLTEGECIHVLEGHTSGVVGVACPPSGDWIASAARDGEVRVWDPDSASVSRMLAKRSNPANYLTATDDGALLAASFHDGMILVWETQNWSEIQRLDHGSIGGGRDRIALCFTKDKESLISGGTSSRLHIWDIASAVKTLSVDTTPYEILAISLLPGGQQFVTSGGAFGTPGEVKIWDWITGNNTFTLKGGRRGYRGLAVDPVTGSIAACAHDGTIRIWSNVRAANRKIDAPTHGPVDAS